MVGVPGRKSRATYSLRKDGVVEVYTIRERGLTKRRLVVDSQESVRSSESNLQWTIRFIPGKKRE